MWRQCVSGSPEHPTRHRRSVPPPGSGVATSRVLRPSKTPPTWASAGPLISRQHPRFWLNMVKMKLRSVRIGVRIVQMGFAVVLRGLDYGQLGTSFQNKMREKSKVSPLVVFWIEIENHHLFFHLISGIIEWSVGSILLCQTKQPKREFADEWSGCDKTSSCNTWNVDRWQLRFEGTVQKVPQNLILYAGQRFDVPYF